MALYKISSSRVNNIEADQYTGSVVEEGLIWYDPNDGLLRLYTGNVGGRIINAGGGGGGNPIEIDYNGNIVTANVSSINFTGNGVTVTASGQNVTVDVSATGLPPQAGNQGKYLYTNGIVPSWEDVPGVFGLVIDGGNAAVASSDFIIDGGAA